MNTQRDCLMPGKVLLGFVMVQVLWCAPMLVRAEADGPDHFAVRGVASGDVLNMRAEPNAGARKIGAIPPAASCVRNLGCRGGLSLQEFTTLSPEQQQQRLRENPRWCQVEYRGKQGWVAGRYLVEGRCER